MLVRDHMTAPVRSVAPDSDYMSALRAMQEQHCHHLPVVDGSGALLGILADRDLLNAAARYLQSAIEVAEVMTRKVVTARPDMPLAEAATLMVDLAIGGLPVVDDNGQVIGIITETDIFRAFVTVLQSGKPITPQ